jgi:hypothetical protein
MSPLRGALRAAILFWAAFQIALPTLAAVADADASTTGGAARAHVEESSTRACVQVHDAQCVLCQYLTGCTAPKSNGLASVDVALMRTHAIRPAVPLHTVETSGFPVPRGPPVV